MMDGQRQDMSLRGNAQQKRPYHWAFRQVEWQMELLLELRSDPRLEGCRVILLHHHDPQNIRYGGAHMHPHSCGTEDKIRAQPVVPRNQAIQAAPQRVLIEWTLDPHPGTHVEPWPGRITQHR